MNIFYLSEFPDQAAKYHYDKHVISQVKEAAQMLSTAHRVLDGKQIITTRNNRKYTYYKLENNDELIYKATHVNHPSTIWVRQSKQHYEWLYNLFLALLSEYQYRSGKIHACSKLSAILAYYPANIKDNGFIQPPQAMPEIYHRADSVEAYQLYYCIDKHRLMKYTNRHIPKFIQDYFTKVA
jgi:hypothetical protein